MIKNSIFIHKLCDLYLFHHLQDSFSLKIYVVLGLMHACFKNFFAFKIVFFQKIIFFILYFVFTWILIRLIILLLLLLNLFLNMYNLLIMRLHFHLLYLLLYQSLGVFCHLKNLQIRIEFLIISVGLWILIPSLFIALTRFILWDFTWFKCFYKLLLLYWVLLFMMSFNTRLSFFFWNNYWSLSNFSESLHILINYLKSNHVFFKLFYYINVKLG